MGQARSGSFSIPARAEPSVSDGYGAQTRLLCCRPDDVGDSAGQMTRPLAPCCGSQWVRDHPPRCLAHALVGVPCRGTRGRRHHRTGHSGASDLHDRLRAPNPGLASNLAVGDAGTRLSLESTDGRLLVSLPQKLNSGRPACALAAFPTVTTLRLIPDSGADCFVFFVRPGRLLPPMTSLDMAGLKTLSGRRAVRRAVIEAIDVGDPSASSVGGRCRGPRAGCCARRRVDPVAPLRSRYVQCPAEIAHRRGSLVPRSAHVVLLALAWPWRQHTPTQLDGMREAARTSARRCRKLDWSWNSGPLDSVSIARKCTMPRNAPFAARRRLPSSLDGCRRLKGDDGPGPTTSPEADVYRRLIDNDSSPSQGRQMLRHGVVGLTALGLASLFWRSREARKDKLEDRLNGRAEDDPTDSIIENTTDAVNFQRAALAHTLMPTPSVCPRVGCLAWSIPDNRRCR